MARFPAPRHTCLLSDGIAIWATAETRGALAVLVCWRKRVFRRTSGTNSGVKTSRFRADALAGTPEPGRAVIHSDGAGSFGWSVRLCRISVKLGRHRTYQPFAANIASHWRSIDVCREWATSASIAGRTVRDVILRPLVVRHKLEAMGRRKWRGRGASREPTRLQYTKANSLLSDYVLSRTKSSLEEKRGVRVRPWAVVAGERDEVSSCTESRAQNDRRGEHRYGRGGGSPRTLRNG